MPAPNHPTATLSMVAVAAKRALTAVAAALFPHFCVRCGREEAMVCGECAPAVFGPRKGMWDQEIASVAPYEDRALATLLHRWKYDRIDEAEQALLAVTARFGRDHAARLRAFALGSFAADASAAGADVANSADAATQKPLLVPVPLHPLKQATRGFNQAAKLAGALGAALQWPVAERLLERRFGADAQAETASRAERAANVSGLFRVRPESAGLLVGAQCEKGRPVALIDDVFTTGATLAACAAALRNAGAGRVTAVTLLHRSLVAKRDKRMLPPFDPLDPNRVRIG